MFNSIAEAVFHYEKIQPQKLCLADDISAVTYSQYAEKIRKYAGIFTTGGIENGDRVVVEASQTVEYLAIQLALQIIGAVFVPVEHNCAVEKIGSFTQRAQAKAVITLKENAFNVPLQWTMAGLSEKLGQVRSFVPEKMPAKDALCEILFSTGTTGNEKGIMLSNNNNIALAQNVKNA